MKNNRLSNKNKLIIGAILLLYVVMCGIVSYMTAKQNHVSGTHCAVGVGMILMPAIGLIAFTLTTIIEIVLETKIKEYKNYDNPYIQLSKAFLRIAYLAFCMIVSFSTTGFYHNRELALDTSTFFDVGKVIGAFVQMSLLPIILTIFAGISLHVVKKQSIYTIQSYKNSKLSDA